MDVQQNSCEPDHEVVGTEVMTQPLFLGRLDEDYEDDDDACDVKPPQATFTVQPAIINLENASTVHLSRGFRVVRPGSASAVRPLPVHGDF